MDIRQGDDTSLHVGEKCNKKKVWIVRQDGQFVTYNVVAYRVSQAGAIGGPDNNLVQTTQ